MNEFRFLVNVDHCIPENAYDCFLYKSRSEDLLMYLSPSSLGNDGTFGSVHAGEIKDYLKRFALRIDFFQIIFAMQGEYPDGDVWENTLLCKLIDIDRVLIQAEILDCKGNNFRSYLSVFMMRRMRVATGSQINDTKYINDRMMADCKLLSENLGISPEDRITVEEFKSAWKARCEDCGKKLSYSSALSFFVDNIENYLQGDANSFRLIDVVRRLIMRYEINEIFVDDNNKQMKVESIFKIIDYSTTPLQQKVTTSAGFKQMCSEHWKKIRASKTVLNEYAQMIYSYEHRLNEFIKFEEGLLNSDGNSIPIDKYVKPSEDTVRNSGTWFEGDVRAKSEGESPNSVIEGFKKDLTPIGELMDKWLVTFEKLNKYADNLQLQLNKHAAVLREKYGEELKNRFNHFQALRLRGPRKVDNETKKEIKELEEERQKVLAAMKETQISPIFHYKEQTMIESKLLVANNEITHYIACLEATKNIHIAIVLVIVLLLLTTIFYMCLQLTVFAIPTLAYPLGYLFLTLLGMAILSSAPVFHYKGKIKRSLNKLEKDIEAVAKKYEAEAQNIQRNLNLCNILDDLTQHIHYREDAISAYNNRKNARKWYVDRAREHKEKLSDFTDLYKPDFKIIGFNTYNYPSITESGDVDDVIDCMLFWPNA